MILYLQKRNPSVPGISDKLYPPQERNLQKVKAYWKQVLEIKPIYEIYGHNMLDITDLSIDHFVPWSYVAHDEFWNLHPTTRSINSSKSNNLPDWNQYFEEFSKLQYASYELIWENDRIYREFDKCAKEHLNSDEIKRRLFRPGLKYEEFSHEIHLIVQPIYQSALNCGFTTWIYRGTNNER